MSKERNRRQISYMYACVCLGMRTQVCSFVLTLIMSTLVKKQLVRMIVFAKLLWIHRMAGIF